MPNLTIAATQPPMRMFCVGGRGGRLNGVYTPIARAHDVKRGNGASGEVNPPAEMEFGEGVGCYVPPSAAYTGRMKGDPLEFSA
jgi:hypothetical protein